MYHLKLATSKDRYILCNLSEELFNQSVYSGVTNYVKPDALATIDGILEGDQQKACGLLLYHEEKAVGCILAATTSHLFNKAEKTAVEISFYVKPEHRSFRSLRLLLGAYRYWAKQVGCTTIMQGSMKSVNTVEQYTIRKL